MALKKGWFILGVAVVAFGNAVGGISVASEPSAEALAAQVQMLFGRVNDLAAENLSQQRAIIALQQNNNLLSAKLKCVSNLSGSTEFIFDGCNVHLRNGTGRTDAANQYGNLILGYNRNTTAQRGGSHNLILGDFHEYTSYGGIVSGVHNAILAANAAIVGGSGNLARADSAALISTRASTAENTGAIIGGMYNTVGAGAMYGVVIGGQENATLRDDAVVVGGIYNVAEGVDSVVCGGAENRSLGQQTVVCGGARNTAILENSVIVGGDRTVVGATP